MPLALHPQPSFELKVRIQWRIAGPIRLSHDRVTLHFPPDVAGEPGVYRIRCEGPLGEKRVYIGETGNLRTRARAYERGRGDPGTTQRVHNELVTTLRRRKASATYQVANALSLNIGAATVKQPCMKDPFDRKLAEGAALVVAKHRERRTHERVINVDRGAQRPAAADPDDIGKPAKADLRR